MTRDLSRLLNPRSIALFGGGWSANVIAQLKKSGFDGAIWPVHPAREQIGGVACLKTLKDLPAAPDACFIGINREASVGLVGELSKMGAGGATCFASGFRESDSEGTGGGDLQDALVRAAGDMPILGPNCYGFLNYLDNVAFWPDQHGSRRVTSGVGIIAQSSNIAINMTMQRRCLPIGMVVAAGNQAQTGIADIGLAMLRDERITAIGLYLEGLGDLRALEAFMVEARKAGKPVVILKTGKSESARNAALTHTASMSVSADFASALFRRLGMVEVNDVDTFLESLKLLHYCGGLGGNAIASVSCSGGEAGLVADLAKGTAIDFRAFSPTAGARLKGELGPIVTIANPLDYHTFIWGDTERMSEVFTAVMADAFDLCIFILDVPRTDRCESESFQCAVDAIIAARAKTGARVAVMSLLPENLSEALAEHFSDNGVIPMNGMLTGIAAIDAAIRCGEVAQFAGQAQPLGFGDTGSQREMLDEVSSKAALAGHGVTVPRSLSGGDIDTLTRDSVAELTFPVAAKVIGLAHKSEAGGVVLGVKNESELRAALEQLPQGTGYLVEEMALGGLCELIIGVSLEQDGIQMLTIGAGGIYAEILKDTARVILPCDEKDILDALQSLRIWPMLDGYRGKPKADTASLVGAILAIAGYAAKKGGRRELDVNPLIVRQFDAIAVDALVVEWKQ